MEGSSSIQSKPIKPVIVRVKRKAFQSALDAFWLEIHERPLKKPLLDFGKLSISDASSSRAEELKIKKVLVQHVETVISSEDTYDVLRRSIVPNSSDAFRSKEKKEGRRNIKTRNKLDQILTKAKERQEVLSRNARFEQVWRSRKGSKETPEDEAIHDMCQLYDVVRVDVEEREVEIQKQDTNLDDSRMMAQYLPLLKEVLPTAAEEIEDYISPALDGYVYDFYAINEDTNTMEIDSNIPFPLVQVDDDDDFYDGPDDDSECDTDDSNAEGNPLNDYPDEDSEDEVTSKSSDADSEVDESRSSSSQSEKLGSESQESYAYKEDSGLGEWSDYADQFGEDEDEEFW